MVTGDFNGDGRTDIDLLGATKHRRMVAGSAGTFTNSEINYPTGWNFGSPPSSSAYKPLVGDFNADSIDDIAMFATSGVSGALYLMLGNANGFTHSTIALTTVNPMLHHAIVGDFNGDGASDFAFVRATDVVQYISKGDGTFTPFMVFYNNGWNFPNQGLTSHMAVANDFNGDGRTDIAMIGATDTKLMLSNGRGNFSFSAVAHPAWNFGTTPNATYVAVAGDFNSDGKGDIDILGPTLHNTMYSNGNGTFATNNLGYGGWNFVNLPTAYKVRVGDYDGDRRTDIDILGATDHYLLRATAAGPFDYAQLSFGGWNSGTPANSCCHVAGGDFNGDGKADIDFLGSVGHELMTNTWAQAAEGLALDVNGSRAGIAVAVGADGKRYTRSQAAQSTHGGWVLDTAAGLPAGGLVWAGSSGLGVTIYPAVGADGLVYGRYAAGNWFAVGAGSGLPAGAVKSIATPDENGSVCLIASDGKVYCGVPGSVWTAHVTGLPAGVTQQVTQSGPYMSTYQSRLAIGANGRVYLSTRPSDTAAWNAWVLWDTGLPAGITRSVTSIDKGKHVQAIASDGRVYSRYLAGTVYTNWALTSTGLPLGDVQAVVGQGASDDNSRHVFAIAANDKVYRRTMDGNQVWSAWTTFSAGLPGGAILSVSALDQYLGTTAVVGEGQVYRNQWDGRSWSGWKPYSRGLSQATVADSVIANMGAFPSGISRPDMNGFSGWFIHRGCELGLLPKAWCVLTPVAAQALKADRDEPKFEFAGDEILRGMPFAGGVKSTTVVCPDGNDAHGNNGCSLDIPGVAQGFQSRWNAEFTIACANHDECFQHGYDSNWPANISGGGKSAAACTNAMCDDMQRYCIKTYRVGSFERQMCYNAQNTYCKGVQKMGNSCFYHTAPSYAGKGTAAGGGCNMRPTSDGSVTCSPRAGSVTEGQVNGLRVVTVTHASPDSNSCNLDPSGCQQPPPPPPPPPPPSGGCPGFPGPSTGGNMYTVGTRVCASYAGSSPGSIQECTALPLWGGWRGVPDTPACSGPLIQVPTTP